MKITKKFRKAYKALTQETELHIDLLEELYERYGKTQDRNTLSQRFRLWRKKTAWIAAIGGARLMKRLADIIFSIWLFIILSPLLGVVALCIKLTDHGPVLYWQTRVGKDNWTVTTADGSLSAHFEKTIAITDGEAEVLTPWDQ